MAHSMDLGKHSIGSDDLITPPFCDFDGCKPKNVEAFGFCKNCLEHLCKDCYMGHRKINVTKNHELVGKDVMPSKHIAEDLLRLNCDACKTSLADKYCENHALLLCTECLKKSHNMCKTPDFQTSSQNIKNTLKLQDHMKELNVFEQKYLQNLKSAEENELKTKKSRETAVLILDKYIGLLKDKIQMLEKTKTEVEKEASTDVKTLQTIKASNTGGVSKVRDDITALKNTTSTNLFVSFHRSSIKSSNIKKTIEKDNIGNCTYTYDFLPNILLQNMLKNSVSAGSLILSKPNRDLCVSGPLDGSYIEYECKRSIALTDKSSVVIDKLHNLVQKIDENGSFDFPLDSFPWDLTVVKNNLVAVTMPMKRMIILLTIDEKGMTLQRTIDVHCQCEGLAFADEKLFFTSTDPPTVIAHDTKSSKNTTIQPEQPCFIQPAYIDVSENPNLICVSDRKANAVFAMDWSGHSLRRFANDDMKLPLCVTFQGDTIIVLCFGSRTLHKFSLQDKETQETRYLDDLSLDKVIGHKSFQSHALRQYIGAIMYFFVSKNH